MKNWVFLAVLALSIGAAYPEAQAARRIMRFAGIAESHTVLDQNGPQNLHLTCNVYVRNVVPTNGNPVAQNILELSMEMHTLYQDASNNWVSAGNALLPPAVRGPRYFRFFPSAAAISVLGAPNGSGSPISLAPGAGMPAATAGQILHGMANSTINVRANMPLGQKLMSYCVGTIWVEDPANSAPGAVIATGNLEAVADSDQNSGIQYGVVAPAGVNTGNPVEIRRDDYWEQPFPSYNVSPAQPNVMDFWQWANPQPIGNPPPSALAPPNPLGMPWGPFADANSWACKSPPVVGPAAPVAGEKRIAAASGPDTGAFDNPPGWAPMANFANSCNIDPTNAWGVGQDFYNQARMGATPTDTNIVWWNADPTKPMPTCAETWYYGDGTWPLAPPSGRPVAPVAQQADDGTGTGGTITVPAGVNPIYSAYPQHIISVPIQINGGKPF